MVSSNSLLFHFLLHGLLVPEYMCGLIMGFMNAINENDEKSNTYYWIVIVTIHLPVIVPQNLGQAIRVVSPANTTTSTNQQYSTQSQFNYQVNSATGHTYTVIPSSINGNKTQKVSYIFIWSIFVVQKN